MGRPSSRFTPIIENGLVIGYETKEPISEGWTYAPPKKVIINWFIKSFLNWLDLPFIPERWYKEPEQLV